MVRWLSGNTRPGYERTLMFNVTKTMIREQISNYNSPISSVNMLTEILKSFLKLKKFIEKVSDLKINLYFQLCDKLPLRNA